MMEWVLRSPQIHSIFGNLGFSQGDGYHVNENCNAALETILQNLLTEDKYFRTFRRNISFGQYIKKDLLPLLYNAKDDKTLELLIRILVNVTIPVECLLTVEDISKSDFGRHTVFEINNLLSATKNAFTDHRATKAIIEYMKKNMEMEHQTKIATEQCTNINNSLLLLRNILHIPEENNSNSAQTPNQNNLKETSNAVQNQILWNMFSQSIDKILIKLMTVKEAVNWAVTMVQLIALLYKDQNVERLHNYLNVWLETSSTDSSEDNESNTSPPVRGSEDSSPILTSDPTSDSSDTEGSGKSNDGHVLSNSENNKWTSSYKNDQPKSNEQCVQSSRISNKEPNNEQILKKSNSEITCKRQKLEIGQPSFCESEERRNVNITDKKCDDSNTGAVTKKLISVSSDCGYATQIENPESVSTSSNENELSPEKAVQKKTNIAVHSVNTKKRAVTLQERKRRNIVKRGNAIIINVQGLSHQTPIDDDISNVLKEFTIDFLLKGYNALVHTLHSQILTNMKLEMDPSHFFWLLTYFLKFAAQIELDIEHISSVLSFQIVSYLTAESVNLCEQFELAIKLDGNGLTPSIRRLHLAITAIREFVQAVETYKNLSYMSDEDQAALYKLQKKMCETDELRLVLVLLLRQYNPKYHTKQYLQDLIVTNHVLLQFMDNVTKLPNYNGSSNLFDHLKLFSTPEIMYQYGVLLEDYLTNSEYVNDCIFTLMHHISGGLGGVISLFQPKILKIFTSIWKSEFEICDDWSDLIEFVINTFVKKPNSLQIQSIGNFSDADDKESVDDDKMFVKPLPAGPLQPAACCDHDGPMPDAHCEEMPLTKHRWTDDEISSLTWIYMQCKPLPDVVGEVVKMFAEDGVKKSRESVIEELYRQNVINKDEYDRLYQEEKDTNTTGDPIKKEVRDDDIGKLCEQLIQDGKVKFLDWVQKTLLETCYAKIYIAKNIADHNLSEGDNEPKIMDFALFKQSKILPVVSPVSYYWLIHNKSVPLVPWNCEQAAICKDLRYLQLLHKLGFNMPVDTGKVFIRIPHFWTADTLFEVANKVGTVDTSKLKFTRSDISDNCMAKITVQKNLSRTDLINDIPMIDVQAKNQIADLINTPRLPSNSNFVPREEILSTNWLEVVQKSQEYKLNLESMTYETASVASDLTRMYVSDEDEKPVVVLRPAPASLASLADDFSAHEDDLSAHEDDLFVHENDLMAHDDDFTAHDDEFAAHDDDLSAHQDDRTAHDNDLAAHSDNLVAHDNTIAQHGDNLAEHYNDLAAHDNNLAAHDDAIAHHNDNFTEHDDDLAVQDVDLAVQDDDLIPEKRARII